jgi:hypothetical protein
MPNQSPPRFEREHLITLLSARTDDDAIIWAEHEPDAPARPATRRRTIAVASLAAIAAFSIGLVSTWGTLATAGRLNDPSLLEAKDAELTTVKRDAAECHEENTQLERNLRIAAEEHAKELEATMSSVVMMGDQAEAVAAAWVEQGRYAEAVVVLNSFESLMGTGQYSDGIANVFVSAMRAAMTDKNVDGLEEKLEELRKAIAELAADAVEQ